MNYKIKNISFRLICILLFFPKLAVQAQSSGYSQNETDTIRFLLIGNSFSWNASEYISDLAEEGGHLLSVYVAGIGGASMQKHWDLIELAKKEPQNPEVKRYNGKSLSEVLSEQQWDIISLQQVSILSGNIDTYRPYARLLYDFVKRYQPHAKIVLMQTWSYRCDSKDFTQISGEENAKNSEEMWKYLSEAYNTTASELGVGIVPVGNAFHKASSGKKQSFHADASWDEAEWVYPVLPGQEYSLHKGYHWKNEDNLAFDSHHASQAGCFLGSLVWYAFLFDESPVKLEFLPESIPGKYGKYLKKVAWSVYKENS